MMQTFLYRLRFLLGPLTVMPCANSPRSFSRMCATTHCLHQVAARVLRPFGQKLIAPTFAPNGEHIIGELRMSLEAVGVLANLEQLVVFVRGGQQLHLLLGHRALFGQAERVPVE